MRSRNENDTKGEAIVRAIDGAGFAAGQAARPDRNGRRNSVVTSDTGRTTMRRQPPAHASASPASASASRVRQSARLRMSASAASTSSRAATPSRPREIGRWKKIR
jgi:hypothetical protein